MQPCPQSNVQMDNCPRGGEVSSVYNVQFARHGSIVTHQHDQEAVTLGRGIRPGNKHGLLDHVRLPGEIHLELAGVVVKMAQGVVQGMPAAEHRHDGGKFRAPGRIHHVEEAMPVTLHGHAIVDPGELHIALGDDLVGGQLEVG